MTDASTNMRLKLPITCIILEIILIILFGTLVQYDQETDAREWHNTTHQDYENDFYFRYPSECPTGGESQGSEVRLQSGSSYFFNVFYTVKCKFYEFLHGQYLRFFGCFLFLQFSLHFSHEILCI